MKALVIGAGKSGTSAKKLLEQNGYSVKVYDDKNPISVDNSFDIIVKSPGVAPSHPIVKKLKAGGTEIIGEVELAYRFSKGKIISITGSNGKSTTTGLIYNALRFLGYKTFIGGNYGIPFSSFCLETTQNSITILELSSFQIEDLRSFKSNISVILNITPDHLNRYGSFKDYAEAKLKLISHSDKLVLNMDDPILRNVKADKWFSFKEKADATSNGRTISMSNRKLDLADFPLKGIHNAENYMASMLVLDLLKIKLEDASKALKNFKGLPHRTEYVKTINGIRFIDDSKSTNVDSLEKAVKSFKNIVLIAGGSDKGLDFSLLKKLFREKVKKLVVVGETADKFYKTFYDVVPVTKALNFENAVEEAFRSSSKGDTVLLSPGCASYDMFRNFEERGNRFKEIVNNLGKL